MKQTTALLMGAAALLASVEIASAGAAHPAVTSLGSGHYAHPFVRKNGVVVLYEQNDVDSGIGIVSQNFESSFDAYDSQAADDFTVPDGVNWLVLEVDVTGVYFNGSGPAASENVFFYKNKRGRPGKLIGAFPGINGTDEFGSFAMTLPSHGKKLRPGTYWVSVQVNMDFQASQTSMDFQAGGEWGWENQTTTVANPAQWQNPGGGFGVCPTWDDENVCIPDGQGDHILSIRGKIKGGIGGG